MASTADISQAKALLYHWLELQIPTEKLGWLKNKLEQIADTDSDRLLFTTFSSIPRYTTKADLQLTEADLQTANTIRSGWRPKDWSLDQAGRTLLLLSLPADNGSQYRARVEK